MVYSYQKHYKNNDRKYIRKAISANMKRILNGINILIFSFEKSYVTKVESPVTVCLIRIDLKYMYQLVY